MFFFCFQVADRLSDFTDDDQPEKLAEDFVYDYPLTYKRSVEVFRFEKNVDVFLPGSSLILNDSVSELSTFHAFSHLSHSVAENFKLIAGTIGKFQEALTWKSPLLTLFVFFVRTTVLL